VIPKDATVLVTGAGGSIGSEVCRQLRHTRLVLLDHSEFGLYTVAGETGGIPVLGSCMDEQFVRCVMAKYRPAYVFHTAAYKHVPMLEGENAFVGTRNNVLSTLHVLRHATGRVVLVSTDKAVNPSCIMGASKRLCELLAMEHGAVAVRFGNVQGSSGSVLPAFQRQIEAGGPVTVTDPYVERYFMSVADAARLTIRAGVSGQACRIYALEMGAPISILALAQQMIAGRDIAIEFIGLRPGEKLREELAYEHEERAQTPYDGIYELSTARTYRVAGRLGWLNRSEASFEETRAFLYGILAERPAAVRHGHLSVVKH
jgi:FlaA1/EpsC-like NDP-sugar epimerase